MVLKSQDIFIKKIQEAEYILIGIGEEWTPSFEEMLLDSDFSDEMARIPDIQDQDFSLSMLKKKYLKNFHSEQLKKAYYNLFRLCKGKKYFLLSLNQDKYPILSGFNEKKCVFPCGNYEYLQCDENCQNSLLNAEEEYHKFFSLKDNYTLPSCPFCHSKLVFNSVLANKYCEGGYLEQWQLYREFLTKTVNRNLCILELGVSMRYPGIIRNAFERTMIYSQKASMFRIHHSLTDLPEIIQNRSYEKKENSVVYMSNLFVSSQGV